LLVTIVTKYPPAWA